jgi:hypothetical protein
MTPALTTRTASGWPTAFDRFPWSTSTVLALAVTGVVIVLTLGAYLAGRRRPDRSAPTTPDGDRPGIDTPSAQRRWRAVEMVLTLAAAGIATATAVTGMWRVFTDALGFTGPGRIALVGFLEIALMVSAIRARSSLRETGSVGVDGAAVWVLALFSAVLSAADAHTNLARAFRFVAPLVAAFMWDRGLASDRRRATRPRPEDGEPRAAREAIAWRFTPHRAAIRLGLADPISRTAADDDRSRRLARLTHARLRLEVLETIHVPAPLAWVSLRPVRRTLAAWRLQRQALSAVKHLRLGADPAVTAEITSTVATVVGLRQATSPRILARGNDPWAGALPSSGALTLAASPEYHRAYSERLSLTADGEHAHLRAAAADTEHTGAHDSGRTPPEGYAPPAGRTPPIEHAPVEHVDPDIARPEHANGSTARAASTLPAHRARTNLLAGAADRAPRAPDPQHPPTDPRPVQSDAEIVRIVADVDPLPSVRQIKATYPGRQRPRRSHPGCSRTSRHHLGHAHRHAGLARSCRRPASRTPPTHRPNTGTTKNDNTESPTQERNQRSRPETESRARTTRRPRRRPKREARRNPKRKPGRETPRKGPEASHPCSCPAIGQTKINFGAAARRASGNSRWIPGDSGDRHVQREEGPQRHVLHEWGGCESGSVQLLPGRGRRGGAAGSVAGQGGGSPRSGGRGGRPSDGDRLRGVQEPADG